MTPALEAFIRAMPKVELHVHLEGAIPAATLLTLAKRNGVGLPAETVEDIQAWYTFRDFGHFAEVYTGTAACICTPDDLELVTREFLAGQAAQHVAYTEVTYSPITHYWSRGMAFVDQLGAINRARRWADRELDVGMGLVVDVLRVVSEDDALMVTDWAIGGMGDGVVALGLAGPEEGNPPERYAAAFARARDAGLPGVPHAGETEGAASVRGALDALGAVRIGHGVRCLEDPEVVAALRAEQVPLEVCPTSNVCLGVAPSLASHQLPRLLDEGLYVTINSDDPPMFGTTLTREYLVVAETFGFDASDIADFVRNAARAALLPAAERTALTMRVERELAALAPAGS